MALKLLKNGRWQNTETGRFTKAPVQNASGRWIDPVTKRFTSVVMPTTEPSETPSIPKVAAPTAAKVAVAETATKAAVQSSRPKIMSGEEFTKRFGNLPPVQASTSEALSFKRGVVNMGVRDGVSRKYQLKLRKMDADKLLELYKSNDTLFDRYFAYEGEAAYREYGEEEDEPVEELIKLYQETFGVKL